MINRKQGFDRADKYNVGIKRQNMQYRQIISFYHKIKMGFMDISNTPIQLFCWNREEGKEQQPIKVLKKKMVVRGAL